MTEQQRNYLEMLIDEHGLGNVVKGLVQVCRIKEDYLFDHHYSALAREWGRYAKRLEGVACSLD